MMAASCTALLKRAPCISAGSVQPALMRLPLVPFRALRQLCRMCDVTEKEVRQLSPPRCPHRMGKV